MFILVDKFKSELIRTRKTRAVVTADLPLPGEQIEVWSGKSLLVKTSRYQVTKLETRADDWMRSFFVGGAPAGLPEMFRIGKILGFATASGFLDEVFHAQTTNIREPKNGTAYLIEWEETENG